jgi:hypothetical protein
VKVRINGLFGFALPDRTAQVSYTPGQIVEVDEKTDPVLAERLHHFCETGYAELLSDPRPNAKVTTAAKTENKSA